MTVDQDDRVSPGAVEGVSPSSIVIIHPGSKYLRIGRASDVSAYTVLHAIARRRKKGGVVYNDSYQVPRVKEPNADDPAFNEAFCRTRGMISALTPLEYLQEPDDEDRVAFNRASEPVKVNYKNPMFCKNARPESEVFTGNEILKIKLKHLEDFNVHFPWRRGDINVHSACGGSLTSALCDLKDIWSRCLSTVIGLQDEEIKKCRAVLVIPDIYNRLHVKSLVNLLLEDIGFASCFVVQDHVAATFGVGVPQACIVDVGDQKTSISCVEDGISIVETRARLAYGGSDMSALLLRCLRERCGLGAPASPFATFDPAASIGHGLFLSQLKEAHCHADVTKPRTKEDALLVPTADENVRISCTVQLGDERLVAALAVFEPVLFEETVAIDDEAFAVRQTPLKDFSSPEDPFDINYLRETRRRYNVPGAAQADDDDDGMDAVVNDQSQLAVMDSIESALHKVIVQRIEECPSEDSKAKMYCAILLVGDGLSAFEGIDVCLRESIRPLIPQRILDVYPHAPEILIPASQVQSGKPNAGNAAWKGAAVMACLESAKDLWITLGSSVQGLRDRLPFMW